MFCHPTTQVVSTNFYNFHRNSLEISKLVIT